VPDLQITVKPPKQRQQPNGSYVSWQLHPSQSRRSAPWEKQSAFLQEQRRNLTRSKIRNIFHYGGRPFSKERIDSGGKSNRDITSEIKILTNTKLNSVSTFHRHFAPSQTFSNTNNQKLTFEPGDFNGCKILYKF
jgi:hypothetical protein